MTHRVESVYDNLMEILTLLVMQGTRLIPSDKDGLK